MQFGDCGAVAPFQVTGRHTLIRKASITTTRLWCDRISFRLPAGLSERNRLLSRISFRLPAGLSERNRLLSRISFRLPAGLSERNRLLSRISFRLPAGLSERNRLLSRVSFRLPAGLSERNRLLSRQTSVNFSQLQPILTLISQTYFLVYLLYIVVNLFLLIF